MTGPVTLALLSGLALGADPVATVAPIVDPIVTLQAALAALTAKTPAAARFTVRYESVNGEGKEAVKASGEVTGEVAERADGMEIHWGPVVLQQARDEERRHGANPGSPTPARDGLTQVHAIDLANRLDAAGSLRDELSRATLIEEKDDLLDGAPVRLLVVKLAPVLQPRERRYLKDLDAVGKLWLGPDGLPLAAEARVHGKGRVFLIITFETEIRQSWRYTRVGDRLVAIRHEDERRWDGAGEQGERRSAWVLDLLPELAPAPVTP
jgi:hypothetical protein